MTSKQAVTVSKDEVNNKDAMDQSSSTFKLNDVSSASNEAEAPPVAVDRAASANAPAGQGPRRRKRGNKRRRMKPYYKMTAEERQEFELKQQQRAEASRAERFAHGEPMAPYNTTQFLFDDYEARQAEESALHEVDREARHHHRRRTVSDSFAGSDGSETASWPSGSAAGVAATGTYESGSDLDDSEFQIEYERAQNERLAKLSKEDLIRQHSELEDELIAERQKTSQLQQTIQELTRENQVLNDSLLQQAVPDDHNQLPAADKTLTPAVAPNIQTEPLI